MLLRLLLLHFAALTGDLCCCNGFESAPFEEANGKVHLLQEAL
jgi:hypothetical protein